MEIGDIEYCSLIGRIDAKVELDILIMYGSEMVGQRDHT
jgi:hypothetical protein